MTDAFPGDPRWLPQSEADIQAAIDQGLLEETHYLDVKRELSSGKGANKELARDMASFGIDGGKLILGLDEDGETGAITRAPQPLAGLSERVEQVGRSIPDPPVDVTTHAIPSDGDASVGYLIVVVPRSANAPHMVDGRYWGRGDKTKYALSDAEVVRLHERRRIRHDDALGLLERQFDRDPVPTKIRSQAHLFLVAQPGAAPQDMLLPFVSGNGWPERLLRLVDAAYSEEVRAAVGAEGFSPELRHATTTTRRAAGAALSTDRLTSGRTLDDGGGRSAEDFVEIEVDEAGGIRVLMTRLSDEIGQPPEQVIFAVAAALYTRRFVALVGAAAREGGYFGEWLFAAGATAVKGLRSFEAYQNRYEGPRYDEADYRSGAVATYGDVTDRPGALADRLIGRFLRSLGTYDLYSEMFQDPEAEPATDL